jgi:hypothetical protein
MSHRINIWRVRAYLKISADVEHPLHPGIQGDRLKRDKSWLGRTEVVIKQVCGLHDITPGHEWVTIPPLLCRSFFCIVVISKANKEQKLLVVALSENGNEECCDIY